jgi:hypothetical protein
MDNVARRVRSVQNVFEPGSIVRGGVRRRPVADQAEAPIDRDMVLVAEGRDREVDRRHASNPAHALQTAALGRRFRSPVVKIEEIRRPIDPVRAPTAPSPIESIQS